MHLNRLGAKFFAKRLANNEKKTRDKAVKKLRVWLNSQSGKCSQEDFLKLWKGLFYCMWFSDKPLVQEQLADTLSQLLHACSEESGILFFKCFMITIGREWDGIDLLRIDKFYMLVKKFFHEVLELLCQINWEDGAMKDVSSSMEKMLLEEKFPTGLKKLFSENIVSEIRQFVIERNEFLSNSQLMALLQPFLSLLAHTKNDVLLSLQEDVLESLGTLKSDECEVDENKFQVPYQDIAQALTSLSAEKAVRHKNRKAMLQFVQLFRAQSLSATGVEAIPTLDGKPKTAADSVEPSEKKRKVDDNCTQPADSFAEGEECVVGDVDSSDPSEGVQTEDGASLASEGVTDNNSVESVSTVTDKKKKICYF